MAADCIGVLSATPWVTEDFDSELNPGFSSSNKPKKGSFEITIVRDDGTEAQVWSGVNKGPPRKLKFPSDDELIKVTVVGDESLRINLIIFPS